MRRHRFHLACASALLLSLLLSVLLVSRPVQAADSAYLVKDINATPAPRIMQGSAPRSFTAVGNLVYFVADDGSNGPELWKSDGTSAGTVLVRDVLPGKYGNRSNSIYGLTNVGGTLFFAISDGGPTGQLWKSDGTAEGTTLVKDFGNSVSYLYHLSDVNGRLLFLTADMSLWTSDGTADGTRLIKSGGAPSGVFPPRPTLLGGQFFFASIDGSSGVELWKSDGTSGGTVLVKDIYPGANSAYPDLLTNVNGTLFFVADNGSTGKDLWKSDGTAAGTALFKDSPSSPLELMNAAGTLFYTVWGYSGTELWKSAGTPDTTVLIKTFVTPTGGMAPASLASVGATLYFVAGDNDISRSLWRSDGTLEGTIELKRFSWGAGGTPPNGFRKVGGLLFFAASDASNGKELWQSDGTPSGTVLVKDINPGAGSSFNARLYTVPQPELADVNGALFFGADDGSHSFELWKSDGTTAGTALVKDINPDAGSAFVNYTPTLADVNGTLFFAADDGASGIELWKSDGTATGTQLVKDIQLGRGSSEPQFLTNVNGTLFFVADDGQTNRELWKSDGTAQGTVLVKNISPDERFNARISELTNVNGTLFFSANDWWVNGQELWKSDGTTAGTVLVKDIKPGGYDASPHDLTNVNGELFFGADDGAHGNELWKSDGTTEGTLLVKDIYTGSNSAFNSSSPLLTNVDGMLFFGADNGSLGAELWKSDGTGAGTVLVKDINPGAASSFNTYYGYRSRMTLLGNTMFFPATTSSTGQELWRSDGTSGGTVLVQDINPGSAGSYPYNLTRVNNALFFGANNGATGPDLWKSEGTTSGTTLVADITPGLPGVSFGFQGGIVPISPSGRAAFAGYTPTSGIELWQTDGTPESTGLLQDLAPGTGSSQPRGFTISGPNIFFIADDNQHGLELWAVRLAPSSTATNTPARTGTPVSTATSTPTSTNTPVPAATSTPVSTNTSLLPTSTEAPLRTGIPTPTATNLPPSSNVPRPSPTSTLTPPTVSVPTATSTSSAQHRVLLPQVVR